MKFYFLFFIFCVLTSCSSKYPKLEELTGAYHRDSSRYDSGEGIVMSSIVPTKNGGLLYSHCYIDSSVKGRPKVNLGSMGTWRHDIGKGFDYDFGYPEGYYRIEFNNWHTYPEDSNTQYSHKSIQCFAHFDAEKKFIILDSFNTAPRLRFIRKISSR